MKRPPEDTPLIASIRLSYPAVLRGHAVVIHVPCESSTHCTAICPGGRLVMGDVTVGLRCEHARNLMDRAREAVDAAVLGSLPVPSGRTI